MKQKLLISLLACLLTACFVSCDGGGDLPVETQPESEAGLTFPSAYIESEYANNPHVLAANKVGEKTIRVLFSAPVRLGSGALAEQIRYRDAEGSESGAVAYRMHGYVKGSDGFSYATVLEFDFASAVKETGTVVFAEKTGDGDRAMDSVLYAPGRAGMYAAQDGKTEIALRDTEIPLPEENDVMMVNASIQNRKRGIMLVTFSVPVRCLTNWTHCVFVSDSANPNPGVGGSWQYTISDAKPVDAVKGSDGNTYAATWRITIRASSAELENLPEQGVVRVSENDEKAPAEYASGTDNLDCGRMVVAIDGRPLKADFIRGWDVAYTPYNQN